MIIVPSWYYLWKNIRADILDIETQSFHPDLAFQEEGFKNFCNFTGSFVVVDNKIVGYVMSEPIIQTEYYYKHIKNKKTLHLVSIAILPSHQHQGLATQLINKVKEVAILEGYDQILLDATNAAAVYVAEKNGFVKKEFFPEWNGNTTAWTMTWQTNQAKIEVK